MNTTGHSRRAISAICMLVMNYGRVGPGVPKGHSVAREWPAPWAFAAVARYSAPHGWGADDGALVMRSAPGVALRMGTAGGAVAASRGPPVNRRQPMPVSQSTNNACLMRRQNMIAVPGGKASHHGPAVALSWSWPTSRADPYSLNSPRRCPGRSQGCAARTAGLAAGHLPSSTMPWRR